MARPAFENDEEDKPLDPAVEKVRRKLVRFVGINLGLLFVALMAVVATLVYKSRSVPPPADEAGARSPSPDAVADGQIALPAGTRIVSQSLSGQRIALSLEFADGNRAIYIFDMEARRVVGRIAVTTE